MADDSTLNEIERVREKIFKKKRISSDSGISLNAANRNSYMSNTDESTLAEEEADNGANTPVDVKQTRKFFENLETNCGVKNHFYSTFDFSNTTPKRRMGLNFRNGGIDNRASKDVNSVRLSDVSTGSSCFQGSSTTDDVDDDDNDDFKSDDDSGTTDEVTINSVESSEAQSSEPSNATSKKEYGFYSTFPGIFSLDEDTDNHNSDSEFDDAEDNINNEVVQNGDELEGGESPAIETNVDNEIEVKIEDPIVTKRKDIERQIWHAMKELLLTENNYVKSLEYVCENYKPEMDRDDIPPELKGRAYYLFGNIEKIYEFHREKFCPALEECNMDCQEIAQTFNKYKGELYIYTLYAMNKPRSAKLISYHGDFFKEKQSQIGDRMGIASYLLSPIQRMIKYGQLIERITKNLKKLKELGQDTLDISELCDCDCGEQKIASALEIIEAAGNTLLDLQKQADDVQLITFVYNSPINLEVPQLLKTGKLIVNRKSIKYQVFLFDNMLLYAEPVQQETTEIFYYKNHLLLDEMDPPLKVQNSNSQFSITTGSKSTCINTTYFKAANKEDRDKWYDKIFDLLLQQLQQIKKTTDTMKHVNRHKTFGYTLPNINNCKINLNLQGRVMKCGDVTIINDKQIFRGQILLFEKIMIITKFQNTVFSKVLIFEDSIDTKNLGMAPTVASSSTQFNVWCVEGSKSYTLQTRSVEEKTAWTRRITDTLNALEPQHICQRSPDELKESNLLAARSLRGVPGEKKSSKKTSISQITKWYTDAEV